VSRITYDLSTVEGIDACEANLNEVEPGYIASERETGLMWGLEIGRRRMLIAEARARLAAPPQPSTAESETE